MSVRTWQNSSSNKRCDFAGSDAGGPAVAMLAGQLGAKGREPEHLSPFA